MRNIQVSADVFQAIWAARIAGEDEEDVILRRLLGTAPKEKSTAGGKPWIDRMYGVAFPDGFEMYRRYLGREYRAKVVNGQWVLNGRPVAADSVSSLSAEVGTNTENGWVNWKYDAPDGRSPKISELRDPKQIRRRAA